MYTQERMSCPKGGRSVALQRICFPYNYGPQLKSVVLITNAHPRSAFAPSRVGYENNTSEFRSRKVSQSSNSQLDALRPAHTLLVYFSGMAWPLQRATLPSRTVAFPGLTTYRN